MAYGAIYVFDVTAPLANEVVVVVSNPKFVPSWVPCRFDFVDKPRLGECMQCVIHSLHGGGSEFCAYEVQDLIRAGVGCLC